MNEKFSILVVDDDERILSLLTLFLNQSGFNAASARSAAEARGLLSGHRFDAAVVDCMMPGESGVAFVKSLRDSAYTSKDLPVIMLTAIDGVENKLIGFENGVDDYLVKPFDERELLARLRSIMNRGLAKLPDREVVYFGDCSFNIARGALFKGGEEVYLSSTDKTILRMLCQKPNQAIPRGELAQKAGFKVMDRSIDVQIARLRKKIGDIAKKPAIIKTERYIGYSIKTNES